MSPWWKGVIIIAVVVVWWLVEEWLELRAVDHNIRETP